MANILFIEDHVELIDEIVEVLLMMHPKWNVVFATDIPEAWQQLSRQVFDLVVIDAMLPAEPNVPQQSEGIFLAGWITGRLNPPQQFEPLRLKTRPAIIILTSRSSLGVISELEQLGVPAKVISRLSGDGYEQANVIANEAMDKHADGQRDFDAFVMSAKGETSTKSFQDWAGGEQVTLAIVFTDVVGSTALGEEIRNVAMNEVRRAHFAQSRRLIGQFQGREIKTIGDSFIAAFKSAVAALDYARALQGNTGHPQVQIRAGIHIGPMHVEAGDVFGGTVNFAARVVGAVQDAEIWLSDRAKDDIDRLGSAKHKNLNWERHEDVAMKGFRGKFTLWALI